MKGEFGLPISLGSFKGWINPDYNHPGFIKAVSDCQQLLRQPDSQILLEGRNLVGAVRFRNKKNEEIEVVIKEFM